MENQLANLKSKIKGPTFNYNGFIDYLEQNLIKFQNGLLTENKHAAFLEINSKRIQRIEKTVKLKQDVLATLDALEETFHWVLITEDWCGDSAQNLPVIAKIADASKGKITLEIILRDENLDLIDMYLSNGSRSIPKLIGFDSKGSEYFQWGPRPQNAQDIFNAWKSNPNGRSKEDFEIELHTWYAKNKSSDLQDELNSLMQEAIKSVN